MVDWPLTLPDKVLRDGYDETKMEGSIRTNMDAGPAKIRRRFTAIVRNVTATVSLSTAETLILDTFYEQTLGFGSLSFNWTHPRTSVTVAFRFVKAPNYKPDGYRWIAGLQMEILP